MILSPEKLKEVMDELGSMSEEQIESLADYVNNTASPGEKETMVANLKTMEAAIEAELEKRGEVPV